MIALYIGVGWVLGTWVVLSFFRGANSDVPTPQAPPHLHVVRTPHELDQGATNADPAA